MSELSTTEKVALSLKKRNRQEKAFQWAGMAAIGFGFLLVFILITDIALKAAPAFHQNWVKLDVNYSPDALGVESIDAVLNGEGNFRSVSRKSIYAIFPEVKGRKNKRSLAALLSTNAEFAIKDFLIDNPESFGKQVEVYVRFDDDVDSYLKDNLEPGAEGPRISKTQAGWIQTLREQKRIEKRLNWEFFSSSDSREPELAGVKGALTGTLLTMLVTLTLSFPLGVAAALYLEEFAPKNRLTDIIEVNINNLAAVPSIIFGLLGLAVIINMFGLPRSAPLVGGLVLTLMTLTYNYYRQ